MPLPATALPMKHLLFFPFFLSIDTEDYSAFQFVPLTFGAGTVSGNEQCYTVAIVDDNILENNETFSVTLSSNEPAFSQLQATVTINHDPADCEFMINYLFPHFSNLHSCAIGQC